jgi:multiple sugar transport system permease protein
VRNVNRLAPMLVMGAATLYFLVPIWWLLVAASKSRDQFTTTTPLWFADVSLADNLKELFAYGDGVFLRWMLNSVVYTGGAALLGTLLAAMCGYALAKYRFPGREAIFNIVLSGVLVPATALALPLFLIFSQFEATNTFWSVFLPSLVNPFGVYLARIYATASVPDELLEAARLDGSGEVTLGLYSWNTQVNQIPELRMLVLTGALVSIVPLVIAFLLLQRFWRNGLGSGAIK